MSSSRDSTCSRQGESLNRSDDAAWADVPVRTDPKVAPGTIGAARLVRQWAQLSQSGDIVDVEAFNPASAGTDIYLASIDLEVRPLLSDLISLELMRNGND